MRTCRELGVAFDRQFLLTPKLVRRAVAENINVAFLSRPGCASLSRGILSRESFRWDGIDPFRRFRPRCI
jgi:hypothetical protein